MYFFSEVIVLETLLATFVCGLYNCVSNTWYGAERSTVASVIGTNASLCYGTFNYSNGGQASRAYAYCNTYGGYLASVYNDEEFYYLQSFIKNTGAGLKFPIWIGLQSDQQNSSLLFWNDTCENERFENERFTNGSIVIPANTSEDASNTNGFSLQSNGFKKEDSNATASFFICRKDENRCGKEPCLNGGTCTNDGNCFTCICSVGFGGKYCENPLPNTTLASSVKSTAALTTGRLSTQTSTTGNVPNQIQPKISTKQQNSLKIRYLTSPQNPVLTSTEESANTVSDSSKKQYNGGGLPQWLWFVIGFSIMICLCLLLCICFCVFGSKSKSKTVKSEPFT